MESVTPQDMVEAEYQNRFEVMYWLAALRMVPRPLSLGCVTDADTHGLDKPCGDAQLHIGAPCVGWGRGVCKHTAERENRDVRVSKVLGPTTKLHVYFQDEFLKRG